MTTADTPDRDALAALHGAYVVDLVSAWTDAGPEPDGQAEAQNDPWHTAVHEAGHAVVGRKLGLDMGQASAAGDGDSAGHSLVGDPYATLNRWWREWRHWRDIRSVVRARVIMLAAGAESKFEILGALQDVGGEHGDEGDRHEIGRVMEHHPVDPEGDEARAARLRRFARALVRRHRADVERVAAELRDRGTVPGLDLDAMVPGPKPQIPDPAWLALISIESEGEPMRLSGPRIEMT